MPYVWAGAVLVREERSMQVTNFIHRQIRKQGESVGRAEGRTTTCPNANNPYGHSIECPCGWRAKRLAAQEVPYYSAADWLYQEQPDYPESPYADL